MRVIAGSARSMPLKTIPGNDTRPTTDRIKETLFNILQTDISGARFLDLYSGSGAIGIEALSRGALTAYFVENNKAALECIKDNLKFTRLHDRGVVMECDVISAVRRLAGKEVFDIIFMDPPYKSEQEAEVMAAIRDSNIADGYTIIIIEAALDRDLSELEDLGFEITRQKKYKTNKHVFLRLKEA